MTIDQFWNTIEDVRTRSPGDIELRMKLLREVLEKLSATEVFDFSNHFEALLDRAYTWDLWGASWVFMDGCGGDDGFWDFCSALISQGKGVFEQALKDPDSLAEMPEEEVDNMYAEGFQYVHEAVQEEKDSGQPERTKPHPEYPAGTNFDADDEDALKARYPKTFARFWANEG